MQVSQLKTSFGIVILLLSIIGCSSNGFDGVYGKQVVNAEVPVNESDLTSPMASSTPTPTPTAQPVIPSEVLPTAQAISYPSWAKVAHIPMMYAQSELSVKLLEDNLSCRLSVDVQPMAQAGGSALCFDVPDLCWNTEVAVVQRTSDFTCAREYRAKEILTARNDVACVARPAEELSVLELSQINDPTIYKVKTEVVDPSGAVPDPNTVLPTLKSIKLDSSCRCVYESFDMPTFLYEMPALEEHCRAHFGDIYQ